MLPRFASLCVTVLLAAACRDPQVAQASLELTAPSDLVFSPTYAGFSRQQAITVISKSRFPITLQTAVAAPFSAPQRLELPAGGAAELRLAFSPQSVGAHTGVLELSADGQLLRVALSGEALEVPTCMAPAACTASRFDPERGCVEEAANEGTSCSGGACLIDAQCRGGACVGTPRSCDDSDACTADACSEEGCVHAAVACPEPADPCLAAACDPQTGCTAVPVTDGTACGENDCVSARVCMAGACVVRPAPEGSRCGSPALCRGVGRCQQGVCAQPAGAPPPRWTYAVPAGSGATRLAVDPQGNSYVFVADTVRAQYDAGAPYQLRLLSFDRDGRPRWSVNLSAQNPALESGIGLMVDPEAGRLYLAARTYNYGTDVRPRQTVAQARDTATGALLWERDLTQGIPIANPGSDGRIRLDVQSLMLLDGGDLGLLVVEGNELHQGYVIGLAKANGMQRWRVHRDGHTGIAVAGNGELWDISAACWSQTSFLGHIDATGVDVGRTLTQVQPLAYGHDEVLMPHDGGMAFMNGSAGTRVVPLPAGHQLSWGPSVRLDGERVTWLSTAPNGLYVTRWSQARATREWTVPVPPGTTGAQLRLLRDGGVLVNASQRDGGAVVSRLLDDGSEAEQCALPSPSGVAPGRYFVLRSGGLEAYEAPGVEPLAHGWPAWDGVGGTHRAR